MMRIVHSSRGPFEVFMLVAVFVSGLAGLVNPMRSGRVIAESLPHWGQLVWYGGLAVAGALALAGALTSRLWSLLVERGGLLMLGVLCVAYSAAIVVVAGLTVAFSAVLTVGLSAACVARVRQINADIRRINSGAPEGGSS